MGASDAVVRSNTNDTINLFKKYLQSKPAVESIIVDREVFSVPTLPGVPTQGAGELQHYQAASRGDAYYLRRLWTLNDVDAPIQANTSTAGLVFSGKWENWHWYIVNTNLYTAFASDVSQIRFGENRVVDFSLNAQSIIASILSMGVEPPHVGNAIWQGDTMEARTVTGERLTVVLTESNNLPAKLVTETSRRKFETHLTYSTIETERLPWGIPNAVHQYYVQDGRGIPAWKLSIYSIKIPTEELPVSFFDPGKFFSTRLLKKRRFFGQLDFDDAFSSDYV